MRKETQSLGFEPLTILPLRLTNCPQLWDMFPHRCRAIRLPSWTRAPGAWRPCAPARLGGSSWSRTPKMCRWSTCWVARDRPGRGIRGIRGKGVRWEISFHCWGAVFIIQPVNFDDFCWDSGGFKCALNFGAILYFVHSFSAGPILLFPERNLALVEILLHLIVYTFFLHVGNPNRGILHVWLACQPVTHIEIVEGFCRRKLQQNQHQKHQIHPRPEVQTFGKQSEKIRQLVAQSLRGNKAAAVQPAIFQGMGLETRWDAVGCDWIKICPQPQMLTIQVIFVSIWHTHPDNSGHIWII